MYQIGKWLLVFGLAAAAAGLGIMAWHRLGLPPVQLFRLPGDLVVGRERVKLYIPLATSLVLSVILTILFNIFKK